MYKLVTLCVHTQHSWRWRHWASLTSWCSFLQRCLDQPLYTEDRSTSPSPILPAKWLTLSDCSSSTSVLMWSPLLAGGRYIRHIITSSPAAWSNVNRPHTTFLSLTDLYNAGTTLGHIPALHVHWQNDMSNNKYLIVTCNVISVYVRLMLRCVVNVN